MDYIIVNILHKLSNNDYFRTAEGTRRFIYNISYPNNTYMYTLTIIHV